MENVQCQTVKLMTQIVKHAMLIQLLMFSNVQHVLLQANLSINIAVISKIVMNVLLMIWTGKYAKHVNKTMHHLVMIKPVFSAVVMYSPTVKHVMTKELNARTVQETLFLIMQEIVQFHQTVVQLITVMFVMTMMEMLIQYVHLALVTLFLVMMEQSVLNAISKIVTLVSLIQTISKDKMLSSVLTVQETSQRTIAQLQLPMDVSILNAPLLKTVQNAIQMTALMKHVHLATMEFHQTMGKNVYPLEIHANLSTQNAQNADLIITVNWNAQNVQVTQDLSSTDV